MIYRILPIIEKAYPLIITASEIIKEEVKNSGASGNLKKVNVLKRLPVEIKKSRRPSELAKSVDTTVSALNSLGVFKK